MYERQFGLREAPFSQTPDTDYFFNYRAHQEAINVLLVALTAGEGFLKITGEVGTGKTLICRKLLNLLHLAGENVVTAYLPNPLLTPDGLYRALADELRIDLPYGDDRHRFLKGLTKRLVEICADRRRVIFLIDEAQAMSDETLEALRLLTNLETEKTKLLGVVLFAQPELDERLGGHGLRQLRQRIIFSYRLQPLDREGVRNYVAHRLHVAGYRRRRSLFSPSAIKRVYRASRGIPRLVNILAHKSMMAAYGEGDLQVRAGHVRRAVQDTEDASRPGWLSLGRWISAFSRFGAVAGLIPLSGVFA